MKLHQKWVHDEQMADEVGLKGSLGKVDWVSDYPDPRGFLGSLARFLGFPSARANALVEHARTLRSRDERLRLYREADRELVAEDVWTVPVSYANWFLLHRPWVNGLWAHPLGIGPLDDVVVTRSGAG